MMARIQALVQKVLDDTRDSVAEEFADDFTGEGKLAAEQFHLRASTALATLFDTIAQMQAAARQP